LACVLVLLFLFFIKRNKNLDEITYNDAQFYDEKNLSPKDYFIDRPKNSQKIELETSNNEHGECVNSSRELNDEIKKNQHDNKTNNILILKQNSNQTHEESPDIQCNNYINKDEVSNKVVKMDKDVYKKATYRDYLKIKKEIMFEYDKRNFKKYIRDEFVQSHSIVKLFLKHSLLEPTYIAAIKLVLKINFIFGLNTLALSDSYIEQRAQDPSRVFKILISE
jgi:hypothetical protein